VWLSPTLHTPCRYLLHHRPCSSALKDFTIGTFFNRVIDDGKASDNTRHMAQHKVTGEPFLLPPEQIRRVVLCTGQIYYQLSRWGEEEGGGSGGSSARTEGSMLVVGFLRGVDVAVRFCCILL
jgi:2-oxoglutarate dehydrogenase E1 component